MGKAGSGREGRQGRARGEGKAAILLLSFKVSLSDIRVLDLGQLFQRFFRGLLFVVQFDGSSVG